MVSACLVAHLDIERTRTVGREAHANRVTMHLGVGMEHLAALREDEGIGTFARHASLAVGVIEFLVEQFFNVAGVLDVLELVPANNPGATPFSYYESYTISTRGRADRLSFISMLICTNDGFTALDSIELPSRSATYYAVAYDARTEMNTEDFAEGTRAMAERRTPEFRGR